MRKEYPVDAWFQKNILIRHRVLATLIVFWMAGLVFFYAPEYGRVFEMTIVLLWLAFIIPIVIGRIIWNWRHPSYITYCEECGSRKCCVKEVDEEEDH
jgi:hypothetical protein